MDGTQLPTDCAGAFVNVYLRAKNIKEAIDATEQEFLSDFYTPVETYAAVKLDLDEYDYETEEEGYPNNEDLSNLLKTGGIWYGPFNCYPPEESDVH